MRAIRVDLKDPINLEDYVQTRVPDKLELSALLKEAKGETRNMSEFAKQCGSSPSSFSRILNCKITKPLDKELILRIAQNAHKPDRFAEKYDEVETVNMYLMSLLHANGMVDKEFIETKKADPEFGFRVETDEKYFSRRNDIMNVITHCLLDEGYAIQYVREFDEEDNISEHIMPLGQGMVTTKIMGYEPKYHLYSAICLDEMEQRDLQEDISKGENPEEYYYRFRALRVLYNEALYLLVDTWDHEGCNKIKKALVFDDKRLYKAYCELMSDKKVYSYMSAILVDLASHSVIDEWFLPRYDGKTMRSLFVKESR